MCAVLSLRTAHNAPHSRLTWLFAGLHFVFTVGGKEYGWAGFCLLVLGTAASVATSVHVNWLAGCAMMMIFFATSFCFAGFQVPHPPHSFCLTPPPPPHSSCLTDSPTDSV